VSIYARAHVRAWFCTWRGILNFYYISMSVVRYKFKVPSFSLSLLQRLNSKFVSCFPSFNTSRGACTNIWTHQFSYFNNSISVTLLRFNIPLKNLYHISNVNIFLLHILCIAKCLNLDMCCCNEVVVGLVSLGTFLEKFIRFCKHFVDWQAEEFQHEN